jgi:hypothetical protein
MIEQSQAKTGAEMMDLHGMPLLAARLRRDRKQNEAEV